MAGHRVLWERFFLAFPQSVHANDGVVPEYGLRSCSKYFGIHLYQYITRDSSGGIVTGYGAERLEFDFSGSGGKFYLLHSDQTGSWAHPASYPMDKVAGGVKLTIHHLVPRSGMAELYFHFSIRVHGVVLN
jgi:hypothetical protein